jgi:hypothetical protein
VEYRLEATRVTADADAEMVVPHSLDLACKTTTLEATAQSLAVSVLDLVATRAGKGPGHRHCAVGGIGAAPRAKGERARAGNRVRDFEVPFVTDMDAAGIVERTGSNANGFRQGDRVITWSAANGKTWGSYAEFMRVPVTNVSPMPKSLSFAQAAAVPVAALTVLQVSSMRKRAAV